MRALYEMVQEEESLHEAQVEEMNEILQKQIDLVNQIQYYTSFPKKRKEKKEFDGKVIEGHYVDVDESLEYESDEDRTGPNLERSNPFYKLTLKAKTDIINGE